VIGDLGELPDAEQAEHLTLKGLAYIGQWDEARLVMVTKQIKAPRTAAAAAAELRRRRQLGDAPPPRRPKK